MNIALWIAASVLAVAYLVGGLGKIVVSREKIAAAGPSGAWVLDFPASGVKAIGVFQILGAMGLILPGVLGIAPILVPAAALGLAMIMVGAIALRITRREYKLITLDAAYLLLNLFVAWGRLGPEAFPV